MKYRLKPANWRTYFGYRPSNSLAWHANDHKPLLAMEREYIAWLAKARGWSHEQASKHAYSQDGRKLISQHTFAGEPQFLAAPVAKLSRIDKLLADIRGLAFERLELVQQVIDERLAA